VKNFLKPDKHTHKDPKIRIASLDSMDSNVPENQLLIERMATSDDDENVRLAAINTLSSVSVLRRVHTARNTDETISRAVGERISNLLAENNISETEADELLTSQAERYAPLLAINSTSESIRNRSIAKIKDEAALVSVLEQTRFHDVRMECANRLTDEDKIKTALVACRSRDKAVAKMLQTRIDEKAAVIAADAAATEAAASTLQSMQILSNSVWSPQHAGRHDALQAKWNALDESYRSGSDAAFNEASQGVQSLLAEQSKQSELKAAAELANKEKADNAQAQSTPENSTASSSVVNTESTTAGESTTKTAEVVKPIEAKPDPARDALLAQLSPIKLEELDAFTTTLTPEAGSDSEKLLAHAKSIGVLFNPPFDLNKGRPSAVGERIKRVGALLKTDSMLPGVNMDDCVYMVELKAHAAALDNRLDKAKQESLDRAKATNKQFAALGATVTDGKWGPASSMFRRLQKKVDSMEPAERVQFNDKLSRAQKQLDEMADWQDFAARPKLEVLCDSMEALPAKELKPEALAKEIKSMQAQWKELGASRASNDLWTRFKTAGDAAYEPCKAFFEEKQVARQAKQDAKIALCNKLESYYKTIDWETPDWKAIQREVNNAKRDWSRNRIPDRKPDRALEQRFSDVLKPYDEKLAEQYDANVLEKRELIEKIQKLAEGEINQHSANQAKRLQTAWKQVGLVRRKDDQALWEEFNGHCKVIYKHQHDAQREQYQASMGHVFRARDIIKTLRKISKGTDNEDAQIQALQTEFQGLAEFPDKEKKFLLRDFRGALDACSRLQENASKKRAQAESAEIVRLVELCEQLEAAVESPEKNTETLRDDVSHAWDNDQASIAKDVLKKLLKRRDVALKHLDAKTSYDYDANEIHRRELLIRMEILADKETPAEDKALRMQYQLENLREGMTSSAVVDKRTALAKLEAQWQSAPPVKQSIKDSLHSRYLIATNR